MNIVGIDEVGRGCLAGPLLVVAARANKQLPTGLRDSKKLTPIIRGKLSASLLSSCSFGEGWVTAKEINIFGLSKALRLGVSRALSALKVASTDQIIIDGRVNYCPKGYLNVEPIIKADEHVPIVSAASIYAKVTRDNFMHNLSLKYPEYGFDKHKGYGTALHIQAIKSQGVIKDFHRINFAPIAGVR